MPLWVQIIYVTTYDAANNNACKIRKVGKAPTGTDPIK